MAGTVLTRTQYTTGKKALVILLGACLTGAMWRARGSHGWGSEWGVFTCGLLLMLFIYAVFGRKRNASFLHIVAAALSCMLTTPAWGTLLNQTSGYITENATGETFPCNPLSGVFIMLCLGLGMMPLFMFLLSRLFSDRKYSLKDYLIVVGVYFAVVYICNATVSHLIIKLVQPESIAAIESGLKMQGIDSSVYSFYMEHFSAINSAKKIIFGRNYFTEVSVISRALAAAVLALVLRIFFKDKTGARVTFYCSACFAVGITVANVFFILGNSDLAHKHPWLYNSWNFWEFFTGFFAALLIMVVLFVIDKSTSDEDYRDVLIPKVPSIVEDIFLAVVSVGVGLGLSTTRMLARRLDASDTLSLIIWISGSLITLSFIILMLTGKLPKLWRKPAVSISRWLCPLLFALHMTVYFFVGYGEYKAAVFEWSAVQGTTAVAAVLFLIGYASVHFLNKNSDKEKKS